MATTDIGAVATAIGKIADLVVTFQTARTTANVEAQNAAAADLAFQSAFLRAQLAVEQDPTNEAKQQALNALTP